MPATQQPRRRAPRAPLVATLIALGLVLGSWTPPARAAAFDHFYADFSGEELMRAINLDRRARGLSALATDSTLEGIARDRAVACPSDPRLVVRGRARDMADRGYFDHAIKGCRDAGGGTFDTFDLLRAFGYSYAAAGEDIAVNNYPTTKTTYKTGCGVGGTGCHGSMTLPWTVAVAERGFMSSSAHRGQILSTSYNRFGCAAWASASGYHYYACYFARNGNGRLDTAGPSIANVSGAGARFKVGSTATFTATASDSLSLLSDGYAMVDGTKISRWAWDRAGQSASISVAIKGLKAGRHTFKWWVRDTSVRSGSLTFQFQVVP